MLQLLTAKPVLYVCNVDEDSAAAGNAYSEAVAAKAAADVCAGGGYFGGDRIGSGTVGEAPRTERIFWKASGWKKQGLAKVIRAGYKLLGLETYFYRRTERGAGMDVCQKGSEGLRSAPGSFTRIFGSRFYPRRNDFRLKIFVKYGGEQACKEAGKMRSGKGKGICGAGGETC